MISNQYSVLLENKEVVSAIARGKLRLQKSPVCGDDVELSYIDEKYNIEKILERKNELKRPPISNVDQALIVMSAKEPLFSSYLVDQLIFLITKAKIKPIILITKMDLVNDENDPIYLEIKDYQKSGYQVYLSGKNKRDDLKNLEEILKNKITVLCGQSGVGKSSLINALEPSFSLSTQEISKALNRGKHTTRHLELHKVKEGYVCDTPGFSKLDFSHISSKELYEYVPDFQNIHKECYFRDCIHDKEPSCAIKEAVERKEISKVRYQHYLSVLETIRKDENKW